MLPVAPLLPETTPVVVALVAAAVIAMSTYVYRSVQATQQVIEAEFQKQ